jgi:hypothetical protein
MQVDPVVDRKRGPILGQLFQRGQMRVPIGQTRHFAQVAEKPDVAWRQQDGFLQPRAGFRQLPKFDQSQGKVVVRYGKIRL